MCYDQVKDQYTNQQNIPKLFPLNIKGELDEELQGEL
jgi:hypothetical protein